jgi:hypothetical protein
MSMATEYEAPMLRTLIGLAFVLFSLAALSAQTRSSREGLQAVGELIGAWRGTAVPFGSRDDQANNFWVESLKCEWKFQGTDAWLVLAFDKSKHYKAGELRFVSDKNQYQLTLKTIDDKSVTFRGELKNKVLTLDTDDQAQRLVFTLLHDNRFLYRKDVRPQGKTSYTKVFQVGATKEGVPFAAGSAQPECVVTGGLGTMAVSYQGKTYFVCCSGCRDEFNAEPAKYVKEFEAKKAKK